MQISNGTTTGVLLSGGLDSSILLASLLDDGQQVQPFYIRSRLVWESAEMQAVNRFLKAVSCARLQELVVLDLPLGDLYREHWSVTGVNAPDAATSNEAVFLPGRNALLIVKAAIWCQINEVKKLALAPLGSSPFADASDGFFAAFQTALNCGNGTSIKIIRPFDKMNKQQVMRLGRECPLQFTFSCISPTEQLHCGQCNKCAERQAAFQAAGLDDPTEYSC